MEENAEEIRQLCNKHGVPYLWQEISVLLGLDGDYETESGDSDEELSDDDIVSEKITVKKEGIFYTMVDAQPLE